MNRILVTGHKGFIGSNLTPKLKDWIGFDLKDGQDIRNKLQLEQIFDCNPIDTVIHLAALTGARRGEEYPQEYFDTNVIGTLNVAKLCEKYKVKKLIVFSSASAETCQNIYGITKRTTELVLTHIKIPNLFTVRPFNVYGENGRGDQVIWKWKNRIKAGLPIEYHGNHRRNYTYVGDVVKGVLDLLYKPIESGHVQYDFGDMETVCLYDVLELFKNKYPTLKIIEAQVDDIPTFPSCTFKYHTDFLKKIKKWI